MSRVASGPYSSKICVCAPTRWSGHARPRFRVGASPTLPGGRARATNRRGSGPLGEERRNRSPLLGGSAARFCSLRPLSEAACRGRVPGELTRDPRPPPRPRTSGVHATSRQAASLEAGLNTSLRQPGSELPSVKSYRLHHREQSPESVRLSLSIRRPSPGRRRAVPAPVAFVARRECSFAHEGSVSRFHRKATTLAATVLFNKGSPDHHARA
jgi:hypothetical protein